MNAQLKQVIHWMDDNHRVARVAPMNTLIPYERMEIIRTLHESLRELAVVLGVRFGSTNLNVENDGTIYPAATLAALSKLQVDLFSAYHTLGLADAHAVGIYEFVNQSLPPTAGPGPHTPNFSAALSKVYTKGSHNFS